MADYRHFLRRFGEAVRERRRELKLSQPQLADEIEGLDQGGISRIENGKQGFDSDTLFQLALALRLPVYALFGGEAPSPVRGLEARVQRLPVGLRDYILERIATLEQAAKEFPFAFTAPVDPDRARDFHKYLDDITDRLHGRGPPDEIAARKK